MKLKKMTAEEQDIRLKAKLVKKKPQKLKPSFSEWLMHDKFAFKVIYLMGAFGGLLVTLTLLGMSFMLDFHITFKVLFGILTIWQGWMAYGIVQKRKYISSTVNDIAYKGKYESPYYKKEATPQ